MSRILYLAQEGLCFYCNKPMSPKTDNVKQGGWSKDHFISKQYLKRKNRHWKLKFNIVLAHPGCNVRKGSRFPTKSEVAKFRKIQLKAKEIHNE